MVNSMIVLLLKSTKKKFKASTNWSCGSFFFFLKQHFYFLWLVMHSNGIFLMPMTTVNMNYEESTKNYSHSHDNWIISSPDVCNIGIKMLVSFSTHSLHANTNKSTKKNSYSIIILCLMNVHIFQFTRILIIYKK